MEVCTKVAYQDALKINTCWGVKEAGLGRDTAETMYIHNKRPQLTPQGACELRWPFRVVPNEGKQAKPL